MVTWEIFSVAFTGFEMAGLVRHQRAPPREAHLQLGASWQLGESFLTQHTLARSHTQLDTIAIEPLRNVARGQPTFTALANLFTNGLRNASANRLAWRRRLTECYQALVLLIAQQIHI